MLDYLGIRVHRPIKIGWPLLALNRYDRPRNSILDQRNLLKQKAVCRYQKRLSAPAETGGKIRKLACNQRHLL
ncbi:MAG: hypothetical protein CMM01_26505 [Rhodopirellula sp.]|nr:hypothetical protein [Rhodopirellula sp.]